MKIGAEGAELPSLTSITNRPFAWPDPAIAEARLVEVARHALASPNALDMDTWHTCETIHCIAGWAVHLAGPEWTEMAFTCGHDAAGAALLGPDAAAKFYWDTKRAREWLQGILEEVG